MNKVHQKQKDYYDLTANNAQRYYKNQYVLLKNQRIKQGISKAFQEKFIGPFKILKRINRLLYRLRNMQTNKEIVVHINRLKPYKTRGYFSLNNKGSQPLSIQTIPTLFNSSMLIMFNQMRKRNTVQTPRTSTSEEEQEEELDLSTEATTHITTTSEEEETDEDLYVTRYGRVVKPVTRYQAGENN